MWIQTPLTQNTSPVEVRVLNLKIQCDIVARLPQGIAMYAGKHFLVSTGNLFRFIFPYLVI
jgi:hypothetical protein